MSIQHQYVELSTQADRETLNESDLMAMLQKPAVKAIIEIGPSILPCIFLDLKEDRFQNWQTGAIDILLEELGLPKVDVPEDFTGKKDDKYTLDNLVRIYVEYGKQHGYIE